MKRDEMLGYLAESTDRYPIWVISYNRAGEAPTLEKMKSWGDTDGIYVLVRESQRATYEAAYPTLTIVTAPDEEISNCGSARWAAAEIAYGVYEQDRVIMMDDDVLAIRAMYAGTFIRGKNIGKPCTRHSNVPDLAELPDLEERVLSGITDVAGQVFEKHPKALLGGVIKQHMSFDERNHQTAYILNGGVTPRQITIWALDRMMERGVKLDTDLFGVHGEDLGLVAEVLQRGGDCFALTSFAYEHWPESINIHKSMIRNAENAPALHAQEFEALQHYPIKDYLRVKTSIIDGSYEWGDVSWSKLRKLRPGHEYLKRVLWTDL